MKRSPLPLVLGALALLLVVGFVFVRQRALEPAVAQSAQSAEASQPAKAAGPANSVSSAPPPAALVQTTSPAAESKTVAPPPASASPLPANTVAVTSTPAAKELKTDSAHLFLDGEFGVGGEIPEGWTMRSSARWGVRQNTIWFSDPLVPSAAPSMYYKINEELSHRTPEEIRTWMYATAVEKERQRVAEGRTDYKNREEITYHQIGDRPALTWSATYTRNGEAWVENLTRLYSPAGTVLFFLHAPASDIEAAQASFNTVIQSTVMPPALPKP